MTDLSTVSTTALVEELERREGVKVMNNCMIGDNLDDHNGIFGKIIVVNGE